MPAFRWLMATILLGLLTVQSGAAPSATLPSATPAPVATHPSATMRTVRIGVLANRGFAEAAHQWQPTADYLTREIPGRTFVIVPLLYDQIDSAVERGSVDFVITHGAGYVELEVRYGGVAIVSLKNLVQGKVCKWYGSSIIARADRKDLVELSDLSGKTFAAVDEKSFGGWWIVWREFLRNGIDPQKQFASLNFVGTMDNVVQAVASGRADAGAVRSDELDRMAAEGKIHVADFKILNQQLLSAKYPFFVSTQLYPEWPMVALPQVPDELSQQVAIALLKLPADSKAARAAHIAGWSTPLSYVAVQDMLKELHLTPYETYGAISVRQAMRQHLLWFCTLGLLVLALLAILFYYVIFTRRLAQLRAKLTTELQNRQAMEESLEHERNILRTLIDNIPDGIFIKDTVGRYVDCNLAHAKFCGFDRPEQVIGKSVYDMHNLETAKLYESYDRLIIDSKKPQMAREGPLRDARGHTQWAVVTKVPLLDETGEVTGIVGVTRDNSVRREKELQLEASEARNRLIIETANDAFLSMDVNGIITEWNPQAQETFGWTRSEIIGKFAAETIIPQSFRKQFKEVLSDLLETNEQLLFGQRLELSALHRDGHEFPAEATISPAHIGEARVFFSFIHDITARKRAEEERDRIFTLSLDMVCVAGFDGYFKRTNPAFEAVLGYTSAEMLQRPRIDFVHPDDVPATMEHAKLLKSGEQTPSFENRFLCKDGSYKWLAWTSVPVIKEGLIYAIAHDMTNRKKNEQVLDEKNHQLEATAAAERQANQRLKEAQGQLVQSEKLAALGQLVAGVAHEINNPLSFVSNNVAVLQRDIKALKMLIEMYRETDSIIQAVKPDVIAEINDLCERVDLNYTLTNMDQMMVRSRDGLKRIQQIVKDLRDFARLDQSDLQEADLNAGVESTVNIIRGRAKAKQVTIDLDLHPTPMVWCYPAKINQVVMNLVANAIDASADNGKVTIRTNKTNTSPENAGVRIDVIDTGSGIAPAVLERIFDPFFTTKPQGEGTGLGLSISYGIVRDHGGTITVESEPGKGSCFTILLPLRPAPKSETSTPQTV